MKTQELIQRIREAYAEELQAKTGWGRVEAAAALERAFVAALAQAVEQKGGLL